MTPRYILTAAGRQFVAYEKTTAPGRPAPSFRQLEAQEFVSGRGSYTDRDTDQAGRFPSDAGPGMSIDERLPMQEEQRRREVEWLAGCIEAFLKKHPGERWAFAAGEALHNAVLERLGPASRANLVETVQKNLVHLPAQELAAHFLSAAA
jgi:hypothetical protein